MKDTKKETNDKNIEALKMVFGEKNEEKEKHEKFEKENKREIDNELSYFDDDKKTMQKIEATLFLAARFLNIDELVRVTGINPIMVKELVEKIVEKYNNSDCALFIQKREAENKVFYKMDVKKEFHSLINKIVTGQAEFSRSEQETLAIIAYKQPIKQSAIIKIRGNKAYEHIKHFIKVGLVKAKKLGRTLELNLSEDFYNYFNLNDKEKNA